MKAKIYLLACLLVLGAAAQAQQGLAQAFSLKESIAYALENQPLLHNAQLQTQAAKARVGQIRSLGLPQINAGADLTDNFKLQKSLVDVSNFGPGGTNQVTLTPANLGQLNAGQNVVLVSEFVADSEPSAPRYAAFAFGLRYAGAGAISGSQLLFDGSYLIGLKAAKVYTDLALKQMQQTEVDIIENVTIAYSPVQDTPQSIA